MPVTPLHTSGTRAGGTNTPRRWASIGLVDSPPPTHRSKPGVPSGPVTPTKEMSLISCAVHCAGHPLIAVLYLRGRLVNSGLPAAFEPVPDLRHVLDPDPVELHVLPVGDVGEVAPVLLADTGHGAQLLGGKLAARNPDPHHEVRVLDLGVLKRPGLAAPDPRTALGVQAPPAEPAAQVLWVDGIEA